MWKLMQLAVRRAGRSGARFADRRVPAAGRAGPVPGSEAAAARALNRQLCSGAGRKIQTFTVDPDLEEQFVFEDCSGEPEVPRGRPLTTGHGSIPIVHVEVSLSKALMVSGVIKVYTEVLQALRGTTST